VLRCSLKAAVPGCSARRGVANSHLENKLVWSDDGIGENAVRNVPMDFLFILFYYLNSVNRHERAVERLLPTWVEPNNCLAGQKIRPL
jgi:hypothetical protein